MVKRVLALLGVFTALGLIMGIVGLVGPGTVDATQHSANRSFSADSVVPGNTVVVTVTATNVGSFAQIVETLEPGLDYKPGSASLDGVAYKLNVSAGGRTLTATLFGETRFQYSVTVSSTASITGVVKDSDRNPETIGGASTITAAATPTPEPTATPEPSPEPEVGPTANRGFSAASVAAGGNLEVTITVGDYGFGGQIVETLPEGFGYVSSDDAGAVFDANAGTVTFTLVDETSFKYTVTASSTPGDYLFAGTLTDSDLNVHVVGGDSSVTVLPVGVPTATRAFSAASLMLGSSLDVTISVADYGFGGLIVETLPEGFGYASSDPAGARFDADAGTVSFTLVDEPSFKYSVTASSTAGDYSFSGTLRDSDLNVHAVGGDSSVSVEAPPGPMATRAFSPSPVAQGATLAVSITATNYGFGGQIVEMVPEGFDYVSSVPAGATFDPAARSVSFTLVDERVFRYTLIVPSTDGDYSFSGTLRDSDTNVHVIGGDSSVTVEAAPGPTATRTFSRSPVAQGVTLEVSITATNYGFGGQIVEMVPEGFGYVSSAPAGATFDPAARSVSFTLVDERVFTYTVTAPSTDGDYSFSGTLKDSDTNLHLIGGDSEITVSGVAPTPRPTRPSHPRATNRAPSFEEGASATRTVAENSAAGTAVGEPLTATDRDDDDLVYSLAGGDTELFDINKETGQLSVAEGADLDFESKSTHSVTVRVKDDGGKLDNINVSISVTDVDEAGMIELPAEAPELGSELTVALIDPDGDVTTINWQWERSEDQMTWAPI